MALGLNMSAVLISTVASAVGLTQVYMPKGVGPRGTCVPRSHAVLDGCDLTPPGGGICGAGGKEDTRTSGAENLGPRDRLLDPISHKAKRLDARGYSPWSVGASRRGTQRVGPRVWM